MIGINKQRGLSLIELMISVTLGITLMAASLQFMISTRQTYELNDDISRIQENGRIALDILTRDLRMAGYIYDAPDFENDNPLDVGDGITPSFFLNDCTMRNSSNEALCLNNDDTLSDRLSVEYNPPADDGTPELDCLGNTLPFNNSIIINSYSVADIDGDGISSLYCESYDKTNNAVISAAQPLVDGIDNMQILYGIMDDPDNNLSVSRYVSGENLYDGGGAPSADWDNIRAVRVAFLVGNGSDAGFADERTRDYRLLDSDIISFTDRQPRRIYSTTIRINNISQ